jgi:hypothetical protein
VRAPEPLDGWRVAANPAALDAATASSKATVLRIAPDEALVTSHSAPTVDDPHAIVEPERAFLGTWLDADDYNVHVRPHVEWPVPDSRPWLGQGLVANVPVKLLFETTGQVLLVVSRGLAHELMERIGGHRS